MVRYVIQRYERYRIYEPAEGGYYYEGREPDQNPWAVYDTQDAAISDLRKIVDENNELLEGEDEGFLIISNDGLNAYTINHKYIGDGYDWYVEPLNRRGRQRKAYEAYE